MTRSRRFRWSTVVLSVLAIVWLYPVVWTLANAVKSSADIYRAPWDMPWPPVIGNIGEAWSRGQLGVAMANSAYVTVMTVAIVLTLSIAGAYSLTRLRPPGRAVLFLLVLAPLIIPTEVLVRAAVLDLPRPWVDQQLARTRPDQRGGKYLVRNVDPRRLFPHDPPRDR